MTSHSCRFCSAKLEHTVVDLGMSPLCESFLTEAETDSVEPFYPLRVEVCHACFLVQLPSYVQRETIFAEYAYFSSYSAAWLEHARAYVSMICEREVLSRDSFVIEVASNDGYLLKNFVERGVPCLGIEPAANVAKVARHRGVPTENAFFDAAKAQQLKAAGQSADLIIANNVLAHVPDLNAFVAGIATLLKPQGTVTAEFPHLQRLFEGNQFDTIYHEHFSYFSLLTIEAVFAKHGLTVFDVEELWSHGGSLRIYARHKADSARPVTGMVGALRDREISLGFDRIETYARFEEQVRATKRQLLALLTEAKRAGKRIVGYGAPGKSATLLNYCGIRTDFLDFTVDKNPYKHGRYCPGTHIPILHPEALDAARPDYILILPWNVKDEIMTQLAHTRAWGARFIIPIPVATVV
jgi:SAM-dependent methyltransferase